MKPALITLILTLVIGSASSQKKYSILWGKAGEKWNKSLLQDFTNAGYRRGGNAIPNFPISVNVKDFGAKGDGVTDNILAFRNAIRMCSKNGAVYIPEGRYLLSDTLIIYKSGLSIKGAGQGKTILYFSKGLEELYPDYNQNYVNQTKWSWSGAMICFEGSIDDVSIEETGIEDLTIMFPDKPYVGHNFHERGYNAIGFEKLVSNSWVKKVTITGCDVGIWIANSANFITCEDWILDYGPVRTAQAISGHHGINCYGGHNLFQEFQIKGKLVHDLSIESNTSTFNVFHKGRGLDMCIDHHNHAQRFNLFTCIDAGIGSRIFESGGKSTPRGISFYETYWNISSIKNLPYIDKYNDSTAKSAYNICVGLKTNLPSKLPDEQGNWLETINPALLYPQDLFEAQKLFKQKNKR